MSVTYAIVTEIATHIPLSEIGICKLYAFEKSTVEEATQNLLKNKTRIKKPWSYLVSECQRIAGSENQSIDWAKANRMINALGKDPKGACVKQDGWIYKQESTEKKDYITNHSKAFLDQMFNTQNKISVKKRGYPIDRNTDGSWEYLGRVYGSKSVNNR